MTSTELSSEALQAICAQALSGLPYFVTADDVSFELRKRLKKIAAAHPKEAVYEAGLKLRAAVPDALRPDDAAWGGLLQDVLTPVVVAEEAATWPELIPLEPASPPEVNPDLLGGVLGEMCRAVGDSVEVPYELPIGVGLVVCASVAARLYHVDMGGGYVEPLNLWAAPVEGPGGRKTSTMSAMTAPLVAWEAEKAQRLRPKIAEANAKSAVIKKRIDALTTKAARGDMAEALAIAGEIAELQESAKPPTLPRRIAQDVTPEKLGSLLEENGECMLLASDEGGLLESLGGRYNAAGTGPNLDLVLQGHAGAAVRVDRGSRPPVILNRPRLSVCVMPQPSVIAKLRAKAEFRGRGVLARFIWLLPVSRIGFRTFDTAPVPHLIAAAYGRKLIELLDRLPMEHETTPLRPSDDAKVEWQAFVRANELQLRPGGELAHMTDWSSKATGLAARLAGVLHVMATDCPEEQPVSHETMRRAILLVELFTKHAKAAFATMGGDEALEVAIRILRVIAEKVSDGRVYQRDIQRALAGSYPKAEDLVPGWNLLLERGYVRLVEAKPTGKGRPPVIYEVNPKAVHFCQYRQGVANSQKRSLSLPPSQSLSSKPIDIIDENDGETGGEVERWLEHRPLIGGRP